jgi:rhodanese-related sulfurtransferase
MNQSPYAQESYDYARLRNKVGDKNFYAMDNAQQETAKRDERAADFKYQALSKDRQKFFNKPVVRKSSSKLQVGKLGETKEVYSPRRGMRRAMRTADVLRKRGYGGVASDVVRGSVGLAAKAPTTRSTIMKKAMEEQDREAQTIAAANATAARRRVSEQFKGE